MFPFQLSDILKFGVDRLLASDDSSIEDVDFESILGKTENGEWVEEKLDEVQVRLFHCVWNYSQKK